MVGMVGDAALIEPETRLTLQFLQPLVVMNGPIAATPLGNFVLFLVGRGAFVEARLTIVHNQRSPAVQTYPVTLHHPRLLFTSRVPAGCRAVSTAQP